MQDHQDSVLFVLEKFGRCQLRPAAGNGGTDRFFCLPGRGLTPGRPNGQRGAFSQQQYYSAAKIAYCYNNNMGNRRCAVDREGVAPRLTEAQWQQKQLAVKA